MLSANPLCKCNPYLGTICRNCRGVMQLRLIAMLFMQGGAKQFSDRVFELARECQEAIDNERPKALLNDEVEL